MNIPDVTTNATITINGTNYLVYTGSKSGPAIDAFQKSKLLFNFLSLQTEQYKRFQQKIVYLT